MKAVNATGAIIPSISFQVAANSREPFQGALYIRDFDQSLDDPHSLETKEIQGILHNINQLLSQNSISVVYIEINDTDIDKICDSINAFISEDNVDCHSIESST